MIEYVETVVHDVNYYNKSREYTKVSIDFYHDCKRYLPKHWMSMLFVSDGNGSYWIHNPVIQSTYKRNILTTYITDRHDNSQMKRALFTTMVTLVILLLTITSILNYTQGAAFIILLAVIFRCHGIAYTATKDMASLLVRDILAKSK